MLPLSIARVNASSHRIRAKDYISEKNSAVILSYSFQLTQFANLVNTCSLKCPHTQFLFFEATMRISVCTLSIAISLFALSQPVRASQISLESPGYHTHYQIELASDSLAIDGIVKFETGSGTSWPDFLYGGSGIQTINQIFGSTNPITDALFFGMAYEGHTEIITPGPAADPNFPPTNSHLVIFMNNSAAVNAVGQSFASLFPGFDEATIIQALEAVGQIGTPPLSEEAFNSYSDTLSNFATSIQAGYAFNVPGSQDVNPGQFSVVSFSDGSIIGTGTVTQTFQPAAAVPEPSSLALLGLGGIGAAFSAYRRRRVA